jgi:hypothetical protein
MGNHDAQSRLVWRFFISGREKAALKRAHSKRFAMVGSPSNREKRLSFSGAN